MWSCAKTQSKERRATLSLKVLALSLCASCLILAPLAVRADLPVHCLHHEVAGTWKIQLSKPSPTPQSCRHARPDVPQAQPPRQLTESELDSGNVRWGNGRLTLQLASDGAAQVSTSLQETTSLHSGSWTMICKSA